MKNRNQKKVFEINLFKLVIISAIIVFVIGLVIVNSEIKSIRFNTGIQKTLGDSTEVDVEGPILRCPWIFGDVDDSLYVDEYDIELLESVIAGNHTLTDILFYQSDVNGDGELNQSDIDAIRNYLNGSGSLPIGNRIEEILSAYKITETEINLRTEIQDVKSGLGKIIWYFKKNTDTEYISKIKEFKEQGTTESTAYKYTLSGLSSDTTYNLYFEVYDVAGNKTKSDIINVTTLKHEKPDIEDTVGPILTPDTEGLEKNLNAYDITDSGFNVKISAQDELSGLGKMIWHWKKESDAEYKSSEEVFEDAGTNLSKTVIFTLENLLSETSYIIYVDVYDVDGNMSTSDTITVKTLKYEIENDTKGPKISSEENVIDNKIKAIDITKNSFNIMFYVQDEESGINKYVAYYKTENGTEFLNFEKIAKTQGSRSKIPMTFNFKDCLPNTKYNIYIEAYDMAGNKSTSEILDVMTLKEDIVEPKIESEKYEVKELEIKKISPKTKLEDLIKNLDITADNYKVINNSNQEISNEDIVGTGTKIVLNNEIEYVLVVTGDIDGNGKIEVKDLLAVNKHRLKKNILKGVYLEAGDINGDNSVTTSDLLQINKARLGKLVF